VPSLLRQQLVERTPSAAIRLTSKGRDVARSLVRSHRLWEAYLVQHFDLPLDHLHEPAERVEHFIGPALQEKLSAELSHPASDPHGRPIPGDEKS
jgi:Mn-dependent DtxR family transcriptional regulator